MLLTERFEDRQHGAGVDIGAFVEHGEDGGVVFKGVAEVGAASHLDGSSHFSPKVVVGMELCN